MSLALDTEKNYFKALIEKSKLIKDEVRSDLIQFLGNPKQPGTCNNDKNYSFVIINDLTPYCLLFFRPFGSFATAEIRDLAHGTQRQK